ncbi:MAG: hypothetical protein NTX25_19915 [Proteobacteria bacterium]|nr:hypothetical protein [Pseudomonadota bacterium]
MFESIDSPLQKLDQYLKNQGKSSAIGNWEFEHYDSGAAEWEGMCDAWSLASISTIEPKKAQQIDGISFSVSDLKALAIKYYESYKPQIFGRRYQGSASTDGQIQDLRPEAFHRIVEEYIGKRQVPIIIDEDPGIEIWSKPMFRMSFIIYKDPQVSHAFLVKAYPWLIRQRDSVEEAPTSMTKDLEAPSYEYRLYYDPQPEADGRLRIIAGEWLGASLNSHPDMVYIPLESTNQRQTNPEISKNSSEIRKLLERAGMFKSQPGPEL